ncbi:MAG: RnfABCDGE type electron transport complex subunit D [Deltaproteobacteria bacterium]|nr:RnfABCDGE type electron transport complex subunit D [Deltaproteobacteria bacterium]
MLINYDTGFLLQYPLAVLKAKGPSALSDFHLGALFLGQQTGGIGASAIVCLLAGGLYLIIRGTIRWEIPLCFIIRGTIRWEIPLCFILGVTIISGVFWLANSTAYGSPMFHLLTGNVIIGAFFLCTDNASSPVNRWGMVVFGFGCGAMTIVLRAWSIYPDGVVFACLLMSLFVPLLDKLKAGQIVPQPVELPPVA